MYTLTPPSCELPAVAVVEPVEAADDVSPAAIEVAGMKTTFDCPSLSMTLTFVMTAALAAGGAFAFATSRSGVLTVATGVLTFATSRSFIFEADLACLPGDWVGLGLALLGRAN